ncbi:DUF4917 family protein [Klebsiella pneumoniae]|uniref:DUF4917 family protein n=1 Tax=Klebsiella pneumoniae TaxID=573 RepID=UPI003D9AEEB0
MEQEFKIHNAGEGLLEAILEEWRSRQAVPLFVSEGTMQQKVSSIQNSYYLSTVYREVLTSQRPSLTILGWGLGEHDRHILKRMRGTGIQRVAVSVYRWNQVYCSHAYQVIQDDLGPVRVDYARLMKVLDVGFIRCSQFCPDFRQLAGLTWLPERGQLRRLKLGAANHNIAQFFLSHPVGNLTSGRRCQDTENWLSLSGISE